MEVSTRAKSKAIARQLSSIRHRTDHVFHYSWSKRMISPLSILMQHHPTPQRSLPPSPPDRPHPVQSSQPTLEYRPAYRAYRIKTAPSDYFEPNRHRPASPMGSHLNPQSLRPSGHRFDRPEPLTPHG